MEQEMDRQIGAASAVMRTLYRSVVVKRELSQKAKLSIYRSIYVPTLTYGHKLWVVPGGPCLAGCHRDPAPDKQTRMDVWMDDY